MPSATETGFLERDGFLGGEAFNDDFEANDFFVTDLNRPAFTDGQEDSFTDFQSVQLAADGLSKRLRVHEAFDRDQPAAKSGRGLKTVDFGDSEPHLTVTDGDCFPGKSNKVADTFLWCSYFNGAPGHQLQHAIADLPTTNRMYGNAVFRMHGRQ